jgi:type 1 glutamine amidotransferase
MRSCTASRWMALPALVVLALAVPGTAVAKRSDAGKSAAAPLRSVSAPPEEALAGGSFMLSARIANAARRSTRPQFVVRLHKHKYVSGGRVLIAKRLGRIAARESRRFTVEVELPESTLGRYWLTVCVRARAGRDCRRSGNRINIVRPTPSAGGGAEHPQPSEAAAPPRFDVLAFTEAAGETHASAADGIDALRDIGSRNRFRVTVAGNSAGVFTESNLKRYRAVVFLNTAGDVLNAAEQTAFENYFRDGGGFLGIHSAIVTEPDWQFLTDLLGTRATGPAAALDSATIKVADRVHDASKSLPEYWELSDEYYNFTSNVRGFSHVLATVDETTYTGGTMGFDHPVAWCKDYQGGRSFYTAVGHAGYKSDTLRRHLAGAIAWTAGESDRVYSDCGATVLANYEQVKVTAPPNINEPIGFDQLPDGRLIQTTRDGRVRLHDPETGSSDVIAQIPVYANSEDGLYGPAVDHDFATNKWVYLYYAPVRMEGVSQFSGKPYPAETPPGNAPTSGPDLATFEPWMGYFQLSRFKFVDTAGDVAAHLDLESEQKIMKVEVDRGACCHVAGDIDFDRHNNLWLVTGDDTPAGSVNVQQFPPFNDMKTNETQNLTAPAGSTGTFTLTFDGRTTGPIALPFDNAAIEAALEALPNITDVAVANAQGGARAVSFRGGLSQTDVPQMTASAPVTVTTAQEGNWFLAPHLDQHQRPARQGAADQGQRRRHVPDPAREPVPGGDGQDAAGDLRDGLPEPVPDPGRLRRHRLRDRLLAGLAGAYEIPRPGRHRPRGDRPQAVQLRLADVLRAEPAHVPVGLQHLDVLHGAVRVRQPGCRPGKHVALEHRSAPWPADRAAGHLVLVQRQRDPAAGHAVPRVLRRVRRHLPAALP